MPVFCFANCDLSLRCNSNRQIAFVGKTDFVATKVQLAWQILHSENISRRVCLRQNLQSEAKGKVTNVLTSHDEVI